MPELTVGIVIVFAIIVAALVMFVWEPVPIDVTAIGVMVVLMVLGPWTEISPEEGLSGFSNSATITILAMMILSEGIRRTGVIQKVASTIADYTGDDSRKQLGATIGLVGPLSGMINNTAAVAMLVPMVSDLAHEQKTSPSKLLMPLSFASMLGGMFTLIGTSTNLLASSLSAELIGHRIAMFEFTSLGAVLFVAGAAYLLTVGYWLTPAHVTPRSERKTTAREEFLTELVISEDSPFVGLTIGEAIEQVDFEGNVTQLIRRGAYIPEPEMSQTVESNDVYTVRLTEETLQELLEVEGVNLAPRVATRSEQETLGPDQTLVEVVITASSELVGETIESSQFVQKYSAAVLAIHRGDEKTHARLGDFVFRPGDVVLIESDDQTVEQLADDPNVIVAGQLALQPYRSEKLPLAVGIVLGVVGLAAVGALPIVVSAMAGVVAMLAFDVVKPAEAYDTVQWDVIFLLAGVIPLGKALSNTGGADLLGALIVQTSEFLPVIGVLGLFYLVTATATNLISNQASVVLLIPVAVDAAQQLGANPFAFILAVTFAASTAFMTPVGYQTNLFVYGPGNYNFGDFARVGGPLQVLCAVVTTVGIYFIWGV
jgi:di/tricarboxylate transporter